MQVRHRDEILPTAGLTLRRRDARVDADAFVALHAEAHRARGADVEARAPRSLARRDAPHAVQVERGVDWAVTRLKTHVGLRAALCIGHLERHAVAAPDGAVLANDGAGGQRVSGA